MGIGRREFLATFGTLLTQLAITPSPAAACHDDLYLNRRLGIAFQCPADWEFIRVEEMGEVQKGQLLAMDDVGQSQAILESLDLPFVALSSRQTPHTCAQMYLASPPDSNIDVVHELMKMVFDRPDAVSPEAEFPAPLRIIRSDRQASRGLLKAFRVKQLPRQLSVSNCMAAEYTVTYDFEHEQLKEPRPVIVRSIAIEHGSQYYLLRLISDVSSPHDFSHFVDSISLM